MKNRARLCPVFLCGALHRWAESKILCYLDLQSRLCRFEFVCWEWRFVVCQELDFAVLGETSGFRQAVELQLRQRNIQRGAYEA